MVAGGGGGGDGGNGDGGGEIDRKVMHNITIQ